MIATTRLCNPVAPVQTPRRSNHRRQHPSGARQAAKGQPTRCSSSAAAESTRRKQGSDPQAEQAVPSYGPFRCSLPTSEMLSSLDMRRREDGRITISKVKPGSVIAEAGVQEGTIILAISDPVRRGKMWPLGAKSNMRMILNMLKFQHGPSVELELLPPDASNARAQPEGSAPDAQQQYIKETLDQGQNEAEVQRRRRQQREDYMAQSSSGSGNQRLVILAAVVVLLPPLVILIAAISTGYLEQLSDGYRGRY
ncbi:hypothetical protein WJX73_006482 [Symbiochloris irregularis]|uniref:PDZ domain-containing protein n=1 Tax=Symbiochloris irregularis TaxID=706552 RepID=A0AAW1NVV5_9CHLO